MNPPEFLTRSTVQQAIPNASNQIFTWIECVQDALQRGYNGTVTIGTTKLTFVYGILTNVTT